MNQLQHDFLKKAYAAAFNARHIYPQFAACEAALESAWGQSRLAIEANNLFGQKQSRPPLKGTGTLTMPTREFIRKQWINVDANWVKFASWEESFRERMSLLQRLCEAYPHYGVALEAHSGVEFITEVSKSWSTDPERAAKVLAVHAEHSSAFVDDEVVA
jgi:flagellum-specific peptidoglycan hydrolase FlgJ